MGPEFGSILHLKSCASTQKRIKNIGGGRWVLCWADRQTDGYGRKGDSWESEIGGLYYSIRYPEGTFSTPLPLQLLASMNLWLELLQPLVNNSTISLKWPNDLLLNGSKIGGVLGDTQNQFVYLGLGLNVNNTFSDLDQFDLTPTSLSMETGETYSRSSLLFDWTDRFIELSRDDSSHLVDPNYLQQNTSTIGKSVTVEGQRGFATGIDQNGGLVIEFDSDSEVVYSSEKLVIDDHDPPG